MANLDLLSKIEAAFAYFLNGYVTATINTGADDSDIALPAVFCIAGEIAEPPELINTGVFRGPIVIRCKSNANDSTLDVHRTLVAAAFERICVDTLKSDLNTAVATAVPNFTCLHIFGVRQSQAVKDGESWATDLTVEGAWCGSTIV